MYEKFFMKQEKMHKKRRETFDILLNKSSEKYENLLQSFPLFYIFLFFEIFLFFSPRLFLFLSMMLTLPSLILCTFIICMFRRIIEHYSIFMAQQKGRRRRDRNKEMNKNKREKFSAVTMHDFL